MPYKTNNLPQIPKLIAQKRLSHLWMGGSAIILLLFLLQLMGKRFDDNWPKALSWLLQNLLPPMPFIFAGYFKKIKKAASTQTVPRHQFRVILGISLAYLASIFFILVGGSAVFHYTHIGIIELFDKTAWVFPMIQVGLNTGLILFYL